MPRVPPPAPSLPPHVGRRPERVSPTGDTGIGAHSPPPRLARPRTHCQAAAAHQQGT